MKIGIVTFPRAINYGTSLQAAALSNVLSRKAEEVVFCEHACEAIDSSNHVFDIRKAGDMKYLIAHLYNLPFALQRRAAFRRFWNKHFHFAHRDPAKLDMVVAGSDQVWNYNLTDADWFYFLGYPKGQSKKVAYAGSFGLSEIDPEYRETIGDLLQDFDRLSVREQTASQIIEDITGQQVPVVLDPTLLMNEQEWEALSDRNFRDKDYIFVYTVFNSDSLWEYAYELSRKTGLPIKTISYSGLHKRRADYCLTAGPEQWLSHLRNAAYVVTNSFHGVAFSVNFQKQFYYELPPKASGVGSRLQDLMSTFGLTHRELKLGDESVIDYTPVQPILEEMRQQSLAYIDDCMTLL